MAKIIYGVSGEGSGHSSRAREIISYLEKKGHMVKVVTYDRGVKNLSNDFDVFETEGLHIASSDNRVSVVKTFTDNLQKLPRGHKKLRELRKNIFKKFKPDCVITDFESMTAYLANHYEIPLISLDNQHRLRYMTFPCPDHLKSDKVLTRNIIRAIIPRPDVSLVTTFYFSEIKNDRTFSFPPILRKAVLKLKTTVKNHILVYLTSGSKTFIDQLRSFERERFYVYGYDKNEVTGNISFKPFSKDGFLKDLSSCKAVMATAGFTLLTESFFLRKPYLALPMIGQFEQEINAYLLEQLNYGKNVSDITGEAIGDFLYHLPDYGKHLSTYNAADNSAIQAKLDELLADNCALAREFHDKRNH